MHVSVASLCIRCSTMCSFPSWAIANRPRPTLCRWASWSCGYVLSSYVMNRWAELISFRFWTSPYSVDWDSPRAHYNHYIDRVWWHHSLPGGRGCFVVSMVQQYYLSNYLFLGSGWKYIRILKESRGHFGPETINWGRSSGKNWN